MSHIARSLVCGTIGVLGLIASGCTFLTADFEGPDTSLRFESPRRLYLFPAPVLAAPEFRQRFEEILSETEGFVLVSDWEEADYFLDEGPLPDGLLPGYVSRGNGTMFACGVTLGLFPGWETRFHGLSVEMGAVGSDGETVLFNSLVSEKVYLHLLLLPFGLLQSLINPPWSGTFRFTGLEGHERLHEWFADDIGGQLLEYFREHDS